MSNKKEPLLDGADADTLAWPSLWDEAREMTEGKQNILVMVIRSWIRVLSLHLSHELL